MARPRVYGEEVRTKIRELFRFHPIVEVAKLLNLSHMTVRRELGYEPMERRLHRKKKPKE